MLTPWKLAMLALLPLILLQCTASHWPWHKLRTWAAVLGSSLAAWAVTPATAYAALWTLPAAYIVIDFIAGCLVIAKPAGAAQKCIGLIYAAMILFIGGAALAGNFSGEGYYRSFLISAGWAQWAILLAWSGWDVGRAFAVRLGWVRGVYSSQPVGRCVR